MIITFRLKGGEGSGFEGHAGIPGHQGGSLPSTESQSSRAVGIIKEELIIANKKSKHAPEELYGKFSQRFHNGYTTFGRYATKLNDGTDVELSLNYSSIQGYTDNTKMTAANYKNIQYVDASISFGDEQPIVLFSKSIKGDNSIQSISNSVNEAKALLRTRINLVFGIENPTIG
jgi:hypothetical protein